MPKVVFLFLFVLWACYSLSLCSLEARLFYCCFSTLFGEMFFPYDYSSQSKFIFLIFANLELCFILLRLLG
jgi:hypothetical protein